ncbi:Uncharacterised protein [Salmonella enterica subsp. indica]|uniref:Uncharacterized protein n=1 Tax=Salmonella enterica subsp. indica TaxID=59207 RepID=A0A379XP13_SALER|nr:Uncharacterised protein [Salmonella enterica subsp. indica]
MVVHGVLLLFCIIYEGYGMRLNNIAMIIILAMSGSFSSQAMAEKLSPEADAELLVWSDASRCKLYEICSDAI